MSGHKGYVPESHGFAVVEVLANPAAGANLTWTVPTEAGAAGPLLCVELRSIRFYLTVINAVNVHFQFTDGANVFGYAVGFAAQPGFSSMHHCSAPGVGGSQVGTLHNSRMPRVLLESGDVVSSVVAGMGVADQISEICLRYRKWYSN